MLSFSPSADVGTQLGAASNNFMMFEFLILSVSIFTIIKEKQQYNLVF